MLILVIPMKGLLLFPPQWYPSNPYPAVPLLLGQLKKAGYDVEGYDLNIDFYNDILTREYLSRALEKSKRVLSSLADELKSQDDFPFAELDKADCGTVLESYPEKTRSKIKKYIAISSFLKNNADIESVINKVESAVRVFKEPELFYDPESLYQAKAVLHEALEIASLPYYPAQLSIANYYNPAGTAGYAELKEGCYDTDTNMFIEYYDSVIGKIINKKADYIIISATDITQIIPSLTLGRMIKGKSNVRVCIGGNIVTKLLDSFVKNGELIGEFCDFLDYGDGDAGIVDLAGYLGGKLPASSVPGLIYRDNDGLIHVNPPDEQAVLNDYLEISFDGVDFGKYFSPEPVLSVQLSKGCYWGKCAFCDVSYSRKHFVMKTPAVAFEELKHLKERYNIRHFLLSDDSVSPKYYTELSNLLIESNLNIRMFSMVRLENGFTVETLSQMFEAGCRITFWGYESEAERVMNLINKGINIDNRLKILSNAKEAGIWNHVAFMFGFPSETLEEAQRTVDTIESNSELVDSCYLSKFSMKKNAIVSENPSEYGLTNCRMAGEFLLDNTFNSSGMTAEEKRAFGKQFRNSYIAKNIRRLWPYLCLDFEYLLLYVSRFGKNKVKNYRLKNPPDSVNGFAAFL